MNVDTAPDAQRSSMAPAPDACRGRGVLVGAFAVLDPAAHADDGLGLTALARASGLAKTSTYRLTEQLVTLGAVQCIEHRYYIGALIGRIGQRGQPDPLLRRAAAGRGHNCVAADPARRTPSFDLCDGNAWSCLRCRPGGPRTGRADRHRSGLVCGAGQR